MTSENNNGALSGVKVIDLTRVLSGPFCTMLLADMGAEVIKIEPPKGDNVRTQGDMVDGYSSYFAQFNRNKKSIILDLYKESNKELLKSLLSDADVVVENFKAGVFNKMGFDYKKLSFSAEILLAAARFSFRASIYPSSLYLNFGNNEPTLVKSRAFNGVPLSNTAEGGNPGGH